MTPISQLLLWLVLCLSTPTGFDTKNHDHTPESTIPPSSITAAILPDSIVRPRVIDFGKVTPGSCATRIDTIFGDSATSLEIFGVDVDTTLFRVVQPRTRVTIQKGGFQLLEIQFCPQGIIIDSVVRILVVRTDMGIDSVLLVGRLDSPPLAGVSAPGFIDMGQRATRPCIDTSFVVRNDFGTDTVLVMSIRTRKGAEFLVINLPNMPYYLGPGDTLPVVLQFCPPPDSSCPNDTVDIAWQRSGDSLNSTTSVSVTGCGMSNTAGLLKMTPGVIDFGTVPLDSCITDTLIVQNPTTSPIYFGITFPAGGGLVRFSPDTVTVGQNSSVSITVTFCPDQRVIAFDAVAMLQGNPNGALLGSVTLRGRSTRWPVPDIVDFGNVPIGFCRDTILAVQNLSRSELLRILGIRFPNGNAGFEMTSSGAQFQPREFDTLHIRFCATQEGIATATALIDTAQAKTPDSIQLRANVVKGGGLMLFPSSITFDTISLPRDSCGLQTLWIVNSDSVPVIIDSLPLSNSGPFSISPPISFPDTLTGSDTLEVQLRYCPDVANTDRSGITIWSRGYAPSQVAITGTAVDRNIFGGVLTTVEKSLDFGDVLLGSPLHLSITVRNLGPGPDVLNGSALAGFSSDFAVVSFPTDTIPPDSTRQVVISFTPSSTLQQSEEWSFPGRGGARVSVPLSGRGVMRTLHLDTIAITVGERGSLRLSIDPPLSTNDTVTSITAPFSYPPDALFFHGAVRPFGRNDVATKRIDDSTVAITVTGVSGGPLAGSLLAELEFTGLTSGQPVNVVTLPFNSVQGLDRLGTTGNGGVLLDGCDVGRQEKLSRRLKISALRLADRTNAAVVYNAPRNATVTLRLVNTSGEVCAHFNLPDGTDQEQETELSLDDVPAGLYILELRAGSDRTTSLILIH